MLNWSHSPPTCRSPSESRVTTWSRVGSLTCLSRIAARWMVFVRSRVSFFSLGSLRGLLHVEDRCRHRNLSPKEFDRLEAGGYITLSAGGRWDQRLSEMEERGIAQIIDTRRFSIPESQSIRQLVSFVIYHTIVIV